MGKSTISMAIFNSNDPPLVYLWWEWGGMSPLKNNKNIKQIWRSNGVRPQHLIFWGAQPIKLTDRDSMIAKMHSCILWNLPEIWNHLDIMEHMKLKMDNSKMGWPPSFSIASLGQQKTHGQLTAANEISSVYLYLFVCFLETIQTSELEPIIFICMLEVGSCHFGGFPSKMIKTNQIRKQDQPKRKCRSPRSNSCQVEGAWRHIFFLYPSIVYFAWVFLSYLRHPYALSFYWHFVLRPLHFCLYFWGVPPPSPAPGVLLQHQLWVHALAALAQDGVTGCVEWKLMLRTIFGIFTIPIGSMYGIYANNANIWGILMVNVTIYSIHGSYGYRNIYCRNIWNIYTLSAVSIGIFAYIYIINGKSAWLIFLLKPPFVGDWKNIAMFDCCGVHHLRSSMNFAAQSISPTIAHSLQYGMIAHDCTSYCIPFESLVAIPINLMVIFDQ